MLPPNETPGLAIALGGAGIRLIDLVTLYAGLARLGTTVPLIERQHINDLFRDGKLKDDARRRIERELDLREAHLANQRAPEQGFE